MAIDGGGRRQNSEDVDKDILVSGEKKERKKEKKRKQKILI